MPQQAKGNFPLSRRFRILLAKQRDSVFEVFLAGGGDEFKNRSVFFLVSNEEQVSSAFFSVVVSLKER